jgi:hypothetical protein
MKAFDEHLGDGKKEKKVSIMLWINIEDVSILKQVPLTTSFAERSECRQETRQEGKRGQSG